MRRNASAPMTRASGPRTDTDDGSASVDPDLLVSWFAAEGRDLPWRRTRDPWAILVSELMLQQTQVARVVDRLPRFLDRFPTPTACADRPVGAVIDEWSGLGYNRRAVNLHRTSVVVRDRHDGRVPSDLADLMDLPGIGPYTARAVRVFAHELDDGVVDTNVGRVLARLTGASLTASAAQRLADRLVPAGLGWQWNQGLMELGALVCRPTPRCDRCPLVAACTWRGIGTDPARGSAGVSKGQGRFAGSDRQGRGRLVDALRSGPVAITDVAGVMGWDDADRARRVAAAVVADGLAVERDGELRLP